MTRVAVSFALCLFLALPLGAAPGDLAPVRPVLPVEMGPVYDSPRNDDGTDPFREKQWYYDNHGQPDEKGQTGIPGADISLLEALREWKPVEEVVLCIVDSGIDLNHEDVDPAILWTNPGESGLDEEGRDRATNGVDDDGNGYVDDVHGWNFQKGDNFVGEKHYHGTHINGALSAIPGNGVGITGMCPRLKIMIAKIFGLGAAAPRDQIALAIRYAADNGASVVSCSFGSIYHNDAIDAAIRHCGEKGILVCCAAGNSRKNLEVEPDYPSCYGHANQLIVSATNNRDAPSLFPNYGPMVDVAAPGTHVFSLMPKSRYRSMSGTSQACPMVAMAACMLLAQEPGLDAATLKARIRRTADKRIALKRWVPGAGRLNLAKLLRDEPGDPLPVVDATSWTEEPRAIESRHPYDYDSDITWEIRAPGARWIRVHFSRFSFDKYSDELAVLDGAGNLVERLNCDLGEIWTEAVPGDTVRLHLLSNDKVNEWGFAVDRIAVGR